jgi:hypothetical protein
MRAQQQRAPKGEAEAKPTPVQGGAVEGPPTSGRDVSSDRAGSSTGHPRQGVATMPAFRSYSHFHREVLRRRTGIAQAFFRPSAKSTQASAGVTSCMSRCRARSCRAPGRSCRRLQGELSTKGPGHLRRQQAAPSKASISQSCLGPKVSIAYEGSYLWAGQRV